MNFYVIRQFLCSSIRQPTAAGAVVGRQRIIQRTNVLENFFILTRQNTTWTGVGYVVDTTSTNYFNPLYRFSMSTNVMAADPTVLYNNFLTNAVLPISPYQPQPEPFDGRRGDLTRARLRPQRQWMTNT